MTLALRRLCVAFVLAALPLAPGCSEADQCASEGERRVDKEDGCCDGLSTDFTGTCQPCIPLGESIWVDGPGCCEGLEPAPDDGICQMPQADTDSTPDTDGSSTTDDITTTEGSSTTDDPSETDGSTGTTGAQNYAGEGASNPQLNCSM